MDDTNLQDDGEEKKPQTAEGDEGLGLDDISGDSETTLGESGVEADSEIAKEE